MDDVGAGSSQGARVESDGRWKMDEGGPKAAILWLIRRGLTEDTSG